MFNITALLCEILLHLHESFGGMFLMSGEHVYVIMKQNVYSRWNWNGFTVLGSYEDNICPWLCMVALWGGIDEWRDVC